LGEGGNVDEASSLVSEYIGTKLEASSTLKGDC